MEKKWNAIYVASRQEKKVFDVLQKKGIQSYLPLVKTLRQWSDRKKMVEFPLLPGYVFVCLTNESQKLAVQQSPAETIRGRTNLMKAVFGSGPSSHGIAYPAANDDTITDGGTHV